MEWRENTGLWACPLPMTQAARRRTRTAGVQEYRRSDLRFHGQKALSQIDTYATRRVAISVSEGYGCAQIVKCFPSRLILPSLHPHCHQCTALAEA